LARSRFELGEICFCVTNYELSGAGSSVCIEPDGLTNPERTLRERVFAVQLVEEDDTVLAVVGLVWPR
jgi:hypothetical protein